MTLQTLHLTRVPREEALRARWPNTGTGVEITDLVDHGDGTISATITELERTMTDLEKWKADGRNLGWKMPSAPWWKRLPVIRHIRVMWIGIQIARHDRFWRAFGLLPTGYDQWVLFGIWHGKEGRDG